jgi:hypothetical protein
MALVSALLLAAAAVSQSTASPTATVEAGMAAYHRGEFTTALALLKPVVYDAKPRGQRLFSDPWAVAYLAQMSRRGEGTPTDWPLSCALFNEVWTFTRSRGPAGIGTIPFVEEGIREVCLPERQDEVNALRTACYLDGVTRREFVLDGSWLVVDRCGIHIDRGGGERRDVPLGARCHEVVVSLTQSDISVPDRWSPGRVHFLELFKWINGVDDTTGTVVRQLHWLVYQVRGTDLGRPIDRVVRTVAGGPYPSPELPPDIRDAVGLRLNAVGQVEWFANAPTDASGIIPDMPRAEVSTAVGPAFPGSPMEEPASDFAVRFDHKGCHYEYLDTFKGTYSHGGGGPRPFPLSKDQRLTLFKAIVAARIFDLPPIVSAATASRPATTNSKCRMTASVASWRGTRTLPTDPSPR